MTLFVPQWGIYSGKKGEAPKQCDSSKNVKKSLCLYGNQNVKNLALKKLISEIKSHSIWLDSKLGEILSFKIYLREKVFNV